MHQLTRNVALAVACAHDGRTHREIAQAAEVSRETFGGCISGRVRPSDSLKAKDLIRPRRTRERAVRRRGGVGVKAPNEQPLADRTIPIR